MERREGHQSEVEIGMRFANVAVESKELTQNVALSLRARSRLLHSMLLLKLATKFKCTEQGRILSAVVTMIEFDHDSGYTSD